MPTSYQQRKEERDRVVKAFCDLARADGRTDDQIVQLLIDAGLSEPVNLRSSIRKALLGEQVVLGDGHSTGADDVAVVKSVPGSTLEQAIKTTLNRPANS
jgi:hypothetical protein